MRRGALALAIGVGLLTGCGSERPEPVDDAIQLDQNVPTDVEGRRLIAINLEGDAGIVSVDGTRTEVETGDTIGVGSSTYEVVQIVEDGPDEGPDGWVSLREQ